MSSDCPTFYRIFCNYLLVTTSLETCHLVRSEETPSTTLQVFLCKTCVVDAIELCNLVTEVLEHTANDTVAARVNLYANRLLIVLDIRNLIEEDIAILESDTLSKLLEISACESLILSNLVNLLLTQRWVSQLTSNIAIVSEEQQAQRVLIEATYRIDALLASVLHQLHYGLLGVVILESCNIALRLVQHEIYILLALQTLVVKLHNVSRPNLSSELGYDNAVYAYQTCCDEIISLATRAKTRLCNKAIQANLACNLVRVVFWIATLSCWLTLIAIALAHRLATALEALALWLEVVILALEALALWLEALALTLECALRTIDTLGTATRLTAECTATTWLAAKLLTLAALYATLWTVILGEVRVERSTLCTLGTSRCCASRRSTLWAWCTLGAQTLILSKARKCRR